jgi:hypothetical protein
LLDLEPEEELQLTHHAHLKFPAVVLCKPRTKRVRRATKDDIIHIYMHNKDIPYLRRNKVSSTFPISKPLSNRNPTT